VPSATGTLGNRFAISHSFNDNKLDDRDPFLENAIASVVSPPTTDHIGLGSAIFGTAGKGYGVYALMLKEF